MAPLSTTTLAARGNRLGCLAVVDLLLDLGPAALTYFLLRRNLTGYALPIETFYPIHWEQLPLLFATPDMVSPRLTEKTNGVHLWSSSINYFPDYKIWLSAPSANSWLGAMCERYGVGQHAARAIITLDG
jgi:hypothetical protein